MSSLSDALKRSSQALKVGASMQISDYEQRFSSIRSLYDDLLCSLIRMDFDQTEAYEMAREFFGSDHVRFAAVDGTMYSRPLFDLVIFFGGAYASTGSVTFNEKGKITVTYDRETLKQSAGISSVVPVYVNEVPDLDQTFPDGKQPLSDETITNNTTIANWIMTFAEYYLAYKLAFNPDQRINILLLDRSLSVERASLLYDTSDRDRWKEKCSIVGYKIDDEPFDVNDLAIARQCICNPALNLPPARADYLRHAVIQLTKKEGVLTERQILAGLGITDQNREKRVRRCLKRLVGDGILSEENASYALSRKYGTTMDRTRKLVASLGDRFFITKEQEKENTNPMKITKDGKEHWLTTVDIAFLTLFTLHVLIEECWKNRILLIGVTKDTAARDLKRQLVPIMQHEDLLKTSISREAFERLPNTDRMILQSTSLSNLGKIKPPWSLIEYDSAFRTMKPDPENGKGHVKGAIKNKISLERTFVKTYVQLSQAKTDPMLRSNVLLIDRLVYPEFDFKPESTTKFRNKLNDGTSEPIEVILFADKSIPNRLQNLAMNTLVSMTPSSIPEAFGHNKPLFIADKIAKSNYNQFKRIVDTTGSWILNNHKLRSFIFYMSTFRERRASFEAARRE